MRPLCFHDRRGFSAALLSLLACLSGLVPLAAAQADPELEPYLEWYLPPHDQVATGLYDVDFPRPKDVLGWEVGTWHVRHDQLVRWYETVAENSPRVQLRTYGNTHEQRPLLLATVSAPENLARIEEIRQAHLRRVFEGEGSDDLPAVVWMGYSVHGNESSGSNAALVLAYHLAAAQGEEIETFLRDTVVLIDPCLNPDGLARFAHWANMHKGANLVGDPNHREHREGWPSGRTNHYWFDLNRDWLLLTHPETRGRLEQFHRWMPQVLTDYHEMGSDSTYFFQPGIPSRQNPLTPTTNLDLTRKIATFHAGALDELGSLYYTEESFDDFYYGKGSTYPDLHGGIGILFEQASSRGHLQENSFGELSFPFTIRNQVTTSLSTLKAAHSMRKELAAYQTEFYRSARLEAEQHAVKAYVFGEPRDLPRTHRMVDILQRHNIRVHRLAQNLTATEEHPAFEGAKNAMMRWDSCFVVPLDQPQFRLIRALFETRTSWPDNTFYDVSSWTLPLSFGLPYRALDADSFDPELVGEVFRYQAPHGGAAGLGQGIVALALEWPSYNAPRVLRQWLELGGQARVATRPFKANTQAGPRSFDYGTVVLPAGLLQSKLHDRSEFFKAADRLGVRTVAIRSGLTPEGIDLGSPSLRPVTLPEPLIVVGGSVSSYEAGEVWHHLDQRLGLAPSLIEQDRLGSLDLDRYTHMILVNGASSGLGSDRLRSWIRSGGVLIATKGSARWAAQTFLSNVSDTKDSTDDEETGDLSYADYDKLRAVQRVAGTIFQAKVDLTHPLAYGLVQETLPVFRNSMTLLPEGKDPFGTPLRYTEDPLVSGYASPENVDSLRGTPAARAGRLGSGTVICLIDNPTFRGVWYGTDRLLTNALYFGSAIKRTGSLSEEEEEEGEDHGHKHD